MSTNNFGRTVWDIIGEHPKVTFTAFVLLVLVLVIVIATKRHVRVGDMELGDKATETTRTSTIEPTKTIHDTIIQTETKYVAKPTKRREVPISPVEKKDPEKSISVKTRDTIVNVTGQPANINMGTNNGIIGNGNDVKINVGEVQRHLTALNEQQLLTALQGAFDRFKEIPDSSINVSSVTGNSEAAIYATEILQFLQLKSFKVGRSIGQFQMAPIVKGVRIAPSFNKKSVDVLVGMRP